MRLYDQELEENIEHDMEDFLSSQSEGKDYGSKVDALVDSMGVTDQKANTTMHFTLSLRMMNFTKYGML